jgi:Methyltransferase domain
MVTADAGPLLRLRQRIRLRTRLAERRRRWRYKDPRGEFSGPYYLRHNQRRQEHLASLGLDLAGKTVLEVGAGIGDHTSFFLDRDCRVISSDARPKNVDELQRRYPGLDARVLDLDQPPGSIEPVDVVYCYGTLYHLREPERAIAFMSSASTSLLLMETCVSRGSDEEQNPIAEDIENPTQAASGTGCRPTRPWVLARLREHFPHAYITATQPWHPEFPIDWTRPQRGNVRAVFVASREPLDSPVLLHEPPDYQARH